MVTLEEFIAETLIQIVRGSSRAQSVLGEAAKINPPTVTTKRGALFNRHDGSIAQKPSTKHVSHSKHSVTFDVQVTASSGSQTKGDAGVKLHVFSAGTGGQSTTENQHINRVQFAIPIVFHADAQFDDSEESDL